MAERIIAPGVYTKEIDQSFLPGAIAQIGAAVVGPTLKGPALVPTQITSFSDYERIFGSYSDDSYVPFAVNEYLRNGGPVVTVTRLLYEGGYDYEGAVLAVIASSGSGAAQVKRITHVLHPTNQVNGTAAALAANVLNSSVVENASSGSFAIKLSGSYGSNTTGTYTAYPTQGVAVSASINPSANNYVTKVFGTTPKSKEYPVYVQYEDKNAYSLFANPASVTLELAVYSNYDFEDNYKTAATPWITSQKVGATAKNLFKFHTVSHGTATNHEVKVGIKDIKLGSEISDPDGYPTFTVSVRRVNTTNIANSPYSSAETDASPDVLEEFSVNLNPLSTNYISAVIGDTYYTVSADGDLIENGDYPNLSKYIRVEVDDNVTNRNNDKSLIPFGYRAVFSPVAMASGSVNLSAATNVTTQTAKSTYHGFDFTNTTNLVYLNPVPKTGATTGSNADFYLGDITQAAVIGTYTGSLETVLVAGTFSSNIELATRKFIVPMQGGFDGARPNLTKNSGASIAAGNTFGFDCSTPTSTGTLTYKKAFNILSNTDYYDINMLLTPGIIDDIHGSVTGAARTMVEERLDTFYIMDLCAIDKNVAYVKDKALNVDSNYTATYWPWLRTSNPATRIPVWVPPSVLMPGVLAFNDANAAPWYAPAGLTRGGLTTATDTYVNLSNSARGELYENRVNPIANFPASGVVVWGQKTLQSRKSALSSVNVRRLLIAVKKFIASSTRFLVFEQNTFQTRKRFLDLVNPYLQDVAAKQGLYAFKVIMDETNNTPDLIDQNILYGQLFLQPTRTAEFILLDFNIQPTGAAFPE